MVDYAVRSNCDAIKQKTAVYIQTKTNYDVNLYMLHGEKHTTTSAAIYRI